jgi:hypothetical protein
MATIRVHHNLSSDEQRHFAKEWVNRGLSTSWARALVTHGLLTLEDVRAATNHKLTVIDGLGDQGLRKVCKLSGRRLPTKGKSAEELQAEFEHTWRKKLGDDGFARILDQIVDMAGAALAKPNVAAGQALWAAARRRRAATRAQ